MTTAIVPATPEEVQRQIAEVDTDFPENFIIDNDDTYMDACDVLREVKAEQKALEAKKKAILKPHDDARRAVMDLFRGAEGKLTSAEKRLKSAIQTYDSRRREEQRRLEQERIEEQRRLEAAAEAEAQVLRDIGEDEAADETLLRIPSIPSVQVSRPKPEGISYRENWKAEVLDFKALVDAVAAGQADISLLLPNTMSLAAMARALKGNAKIPGVRVYSEAGMAVRA